MGCVTRSGSFSRFLVAVVWEMELMIFTLIGARRYWPVWKSLIIRVEHASTPTPDQGVQAYHLHYLQQATQTLILVTVTNLKRTGFEKVTILHDCSGGAKFVHGRLSKRLPQVGSTLCASCRTTRGASSRPPSTSSPALCLFDVQGQQRLHAYSNHRTLSSRVSWPQIDRPAS